MGASSQYRPGLRVVTRTISPPRASNSSDRFPQEAWNVPVSFFPFMVRNAQCRGKKLESPLKYAAMEEVVVASSQHESRVAPAPLADPGVFKKSLPAAR